MSSISLTRLQEERKKWRKDHPHGFIAKPMKRDDKLDLMVWQCKIPGPPNTIWEGGVYPVTMEFPASYPLKGPRCRFPVGFYHNNVFPSGDICLSTLYDWSPSTSIKELLLSIHHLLIEPNVEHIAGPEAYQDIHHNKDIYIQKIRAQALKYAGNYQ